MTVNILNYIRYYIKDSRGAATSLIETALVVAVVAILASSTMVPSTETFDRAGVAHAAADTKAIAAAVHSFMQDTGLAPAFKSGTAHGPNDPVLFVLTTEGSDPLIDSSLGWPKADQGLIENHLVKNRPGGSVEHPYLRMGEISFNRFRGWNGPYLAQIPDSDPWNDKYFVTVQWLTPKGVTMGTNSDPDAAPLLELGTGQRAAAFVISAGPNRTLETKFAQAADGFAPSGDDIVYRIQ